MEQKDYYKMLGVDKDATQAQIGQAYRKLAFQYHPDRNKGDAAATEKMKRINEAYATLSNPHKRSEYDALRERYGDLAYDRYRQAHSPEDIFRGSDIDQIFEEFARTFGFRSSDEIFREFYGSGDRTYQFGRPGQFGRAFIFYGSSGGSPARQGQPEPGQTQLPELAFPGVFGRLLKFALKTAGIEVPERGKDLKDVITLTAERAANGGEVEYTYRKSQPPRNFMVKVPPGTKSGQRIRLKGMGAPGKAGGPSGDLYLLVRVRISLLQRIRNLFKTWFSP